MSALAFWLVVAGCFLVIAGVLKHAHNIEKARRRAVEDLEMERNVAAADWDFPEPWREAA